MSHRRKHYLYLVNRHHADLTAAVFFSAPPAGLRDWASGEAAAAGTGELKVRLPAFSLRSFAMPSGAAAVERCTVDMPRDLLDQIESTLTRLRESRKKAPPRDIP